MADAIRYPFLPIIYVRGYAATMSAIEDATSDPYMGFNLGSTKLRQNAAKEPVRFIFESPLLRLIKDHGYADAFHDGGDEHVPGSAPSRSIWVFRYYEQVSASLGDGERRSMEDFATDLRAFILTVRDAVCGDDAAAREQFAVYLVAHSMGGLICRAYLQNICRHGAPDPARNQELELAAGKASPHYVDKIYTYGTPHDGIDFAGINVPDLGPFDRLQASNFNRDRMREYLTLPAAKKGARVNTLDGAFPSARCFCFIGSNHRDYVVGASKRATGPMSDGLVMMQNAYVENAPRAVAHRSHSGPFGIVNSEAGYQNLQRFLFGELRVAATLQVDALPLADAVQQKKDAGAEIRGSYYFDVATQVRGGANYYLNERRQEQGSAILESYDELVHAGKRVYLFTGYLLRQENRTSDRALMFAIDIGVRVPTFEIDRKFWFAEHFEGFLYQESVTFAVRDKTLRYGLASVHGFGNAPEAARETTHDGGREISIPLTTREDVRPGFKGCLKLRVEPWRTRLNSS